MEAERAKRHNFTYGMTFNAELAKAKTSIERAREFEDIIKEYIKIQGLKYSFIMSKNSSKKSDWPAKRLMFARACFRPDFRNGR